MDVVLVIAKIQIDFQIFKTVVLGINAGSMAGAKILGPRGICRPGVLRLEVQAGLTIQEKYAHMLFLIMAASLQTLRRL